MTDIQNIQAAVLNSAIFGTFELGEIKDIIQPIIFGKYRKVFEFIIKNGKENCCGTGGINLEMAKLGNDLMLEIINPVYITYNPYEDIISLYKMYMDEKAKEKFDFEEINEINDRIISIRNRFAGKENNTYSVNSIYDEIYEEGLILKGKDGISGYKTGVPSLDDNCDGLQRGTVMRLTAYSNIGKSKLSYHICNSILEQKAKVIYFSLEVPRKRVLHNLIMNSCNISYKDATKGKWIDDESKVVKVNEYMCGIHKNLEIIDDKYHLDQIIQYCDAKKPDVIFIDFVQNIITGDKDEYSTMTKVALYIQQMAIRNNIAVFDMSQTSNDGAKYSMGSVIPSKGSGALVASSDINLVMQRDGDTNHNILYIAKNKFGPNNKAIDLEFNFEYGGIKDCGYHLLKNNSN